MQRTFAKSPFSWAVTNLVSADSSNLCSASRMPLYIYRGRYNAEAVKGIMDAPEDREAAIARVLHSALSVAIVGAAAGSISNLKTTIALTSNEAMAAFKTAGDLAKVFKSAGH